MILQSLVELYERLEEDEKVPPKGWCQAKVSYVLNLSKEGKILSIVSLKEEQERGKKKVLIPSILTVPEMVTRSSLKVSANFLCDNSKYMLGIDVGGTDQRALECFQAAKERHISLLKEIEGPMAQAVCLYFQNWDPKSARINPIINERWDEITDGGNLIFSMGMDYAQDDYKIKEMWNQITEKTEGEQKGICLVTGKKAIISRIHKTIKGVPGAQPSGAALVSFNFKSSESYGKSQSYNAPVGEYAEFAYTTALNYLLGQREYTLLLGDSMIMFWAENGKEVYQDIFAKSLNPQKDNEKILKDIFEQFRGKELVQMDEVQLNLKQKFCVLALAPNAARLSVRLFYQNSLGNILKSISNHYQRMEIIRPVWEEKEYLGIRDMLFETINQKSKDQSPIPNMAAMVLQAILSDSRYPVGLYSNTILRIKAEQGNVTWGRAGIIKAFLIQNYGWNKGDDYVALNQESKDVAYVLGRLFFVLESIQLDANPGIKSTIRDRYFNSACATPASIFPILIKLKNSHMKKLERDRGGSKIYYEQMLSDIMGKISKFPKRLSLEQQGAFSLGYYHQMQQKYKKKEDN